jgi:hypothetical protein
MKLGPRIFGKWGVVEPGNSRYQIMLDLAEIVVIVEEGDHISNMTSKSIATRVGLAKCFAK